MPIFQMYMMKNIKTCGKLLLKWLQMLEIKRVANNKWIQMVTGWESMLVCDKI